MPEWRRLWFAIIALIGITTAGTVGYVVLGFTPLDALYQTIMTVTTVGFREVEPLSGAGKVFTMVVMVVGVGTALYTLSLVIEAVLENQLPEVFGRRRMERRITGMQDHVIVCGWGRVGRAITRELAAMDAETVVVDNDPERLGDVPHTVLLGDATDDEVLERAGVRRARALVAALSTDAGNLFVTVSARALRPDLFIVARVRVEDNEEKLRRAGADRVVNPQSIGGARMAAFVLQPHVTEFLDVVMHERDIEFRLEEVPVPEASPIEGSSIRDAHVRDRTGALVLALRDRDGSFTTNPAPETVIHAGQVVIAIGTPADLDALERLVGGETPRVPG
ncbi:MAG TPA: potassium channel protein [Acidimicrobiia bacterium]|nr:potassium channel protein [Acidimicrobiia bacterium]